MAVKLFTAAERPDLIAAGVESASVWPEYNLHGDVLNQFWGRLIPELPDFQFVLIDEATDTVVAEGHTAPLWWDGNEGTLPRGIDDAIQQAFARNDSRKPVNTLCAMAAEVPLEWRSQGLAGQVLKGMRDIAERNGLEHMIAPVRPSWKERYPLTDIARYAAWRRSDRQHFDPWMRVHERVGAKVSTPIPQSMRITGTIAEWQAWTGLTYPESGHYVFPQGLDVLEIDTARGLGTYWEPNIWMIHPRVM